MSESELFRRLWHPHYVMNALLCLPLPIALLLSRSLDLRSSALLGAVPLALFARSHGSNKNAETQVESISFGGRLFNASGLLWMRDLGQIRITRWHALVYIIVWALVSFLLPQPPYLGPSHVTALTTEAFDEDVLIVPPAESVTTLLPDDGAPSEPRIVELPSPSEIKALYDARRRQSNAYSLVLFHAEWMKKSRELEITLSRLSQRFTSPTLKFYITTPDLAPQSFYDQHLATTTMSPDLPVIRLYHLGRAISQLPRGVDDLKAERRRKRNERRRSARLAKSKTQATDESESGTDESEDERESEQMVAMERYRWDRSAGSIIETFRLRERAGTSCDRAAT